MLLAQPEPTYRPQIVAVSTVGTTATLVPQLSRPASAAMRVVILESSMVSAASQWLDITKVM